MMGRKTYLNLRNFLIYIRNNYAISSMCAAALSFLLPFPDEVAHGIRSYFVNLPNIPLVSATFFSLPEGPKVWAKVFIISNIFNLLVHGRD